MVYYDTPLGTQLQNQSSPQLRNNFSQANTSFSVDHIGFGIATNNGLHNQVTTAACSNPSGSPTTEPTTTSTTCAFYAKQYNTNVGLLQYSKLPSNGVSTPVTARQSSSTAISLGAGSTVDILDFTGINVGIADFYAINASGTPTICYGNVFWSGTAFNFFTQSNSSSPLQVTKNGNVLILKNNSGVSYDNIYWTLKFVRIQ